MKTVRAQLIGGLGNRMFIWSHAKKFCEQNSYALHCQEWPGERIFTLDGYTPIRPTGHEDIVIDGYRQTQADLIYSRADCRRWFKLRPEVEAELRHHAAYWPHAHFRRGDYVGLYPIISRKAVDAAVAEHQFPGELRKNMIPGREYHAVSDETPLLDPNFTGDLAMLPDFYRLMRAPVLYRANSTFSYWAGVLGHGKVFSPIITGLVGGVEHDEVKYVPGNHPAIADLPGIVTELHLKET